MLKRTSEHLVNDGKAELTTVLCQDAHFIFEEYRRGEQITVYWEKKDVATKTNIT